MHSNICKHTRNNMVWTHWDRFSGTFFTNLEEQFSRLCVLHPDDLTPFHKCWSTDSEEAHPQPTVFVLLCVFLSKHDYTVGKVWDHCHAKIYHSSVFPTCFPFIEASSTETISDEVSVDETKDQMDLSDPASGLCWIVFSCYLQTWHSDTFHHLQIFFSPATSYFVLYLPSLVRFLTDTIYTMLRSL